MKKLIAHRCINGWLVEIKEVVRVDTKADVFKLIKKNRLKLWQDKHISDKIYAD